MTQRFLQRTAVNLALFLLVVVSACTMKSQEAPPLTGPSEFGTSITVSATPDAITQDGASQSLITISARDSNGKPKRNLSVRSEITVGGVRVDFGALSARNLVTGNDGQATLVYTAPPAIGSTASVDQNTIVNIQVTPYGTDFSNEVPRLVSIRLLPIGVVLAPNGTPKPNFTFSPATANENVKIAFDASSSTDDGRIISYSWTFGDGDSGTGATISRAFAAAGAYNVTLTVTDDRGLSASITKVVTIGIGTNPTAAFTVSPTPPSLNATTFFDATLSSASPGRKLAAYAWTFGDGGTASGVSATHTYAIAGSYAVTLKVTDDLGKTGVSTQTLSVGTVDLKADLTVSPSAAVINSPVQAVASGSTTQPGQTIVQYDFNFGDGQSDSIVSGSNAVATHYYRTIGKYTITLTIRDSAGRTATKLGTVDITGGVSQPVAVFSYSPDSPVTVGTVVTFNASNSQAPQNASISRYEWSFGDPGSSVYTTTSPTIPYQYSTLGTFTVTLTVYDNQGGKNSTSRPITVR